MNSDSFYKDANGGGYGGENNTDDVGNERERSAAKFASPQEIFSFFGNKSQDELLAEIFRQAASKRADGTLVTEDLDRFYAQVAPFMKPEQRRKLDDLIKRLK